MIPQVSRLVGRSDRPPAPAVSCRPLLMPVRCAARTATPPISAVSQTGEGAEQGRRGAQRKPVGEVEHDEDDRRRAGEPDPDRALALEQRWEHEPHHNDRREARPSRASSPLSRATAIVTRAKNTAMATRGGRAERRRTGKPPASQFFPGRRSVPPMIVAVVMVLQRIEGCSDREGSGPVRYRGDVELRRFGGFQGGRVAFWVQSQCRPVGWAAPPIRTVAAPDSAVRGWSQ
jgi:hypothetical protein